MRYWSIGLLFIVTVTVTVLSMEDIKRQHMGGNKMKFVVSDDSISNCQYMLFRQPLSFTDAKAKCASLIDTNSPSGRGRLAVIRSVNDNQELTSLLQHAFGYKFKVSYARKTDWVWIGQTLNNRGKWVDEDGNEVSFHNWERGQPDSKITDGAMQTSIRLGKHGKWDDTFPDKMHPYVCTHTEHFIYSTSKVTWETAVNYCSYGGMTLAHDLSPEENIAIIKLAREKSPVDELGERHPYLNRNWVWLGASDNHTEGIWRWTRGTRLYYSNWEKTQPDNLIDDYLENRETTGQHFASLSKITGGWDDSFNTRLREYVCMCSEHDFQGAGDLDEELTKMLQNQTETWELLQEEMKKEINPNSSEPPAECKTQRYYAYEERLGWFDAKIMCESQGMTLAKISTLRQNYDATRAMFRSDPVNMESMRQYYNDDNWFWIGLSDWKHEGRFVWTDGSDINFENWGSRQPDNVRLKEYGLTGQHYVAVHKLLRFWDDSGDRKLPFLCQCPDWDNEEQTEEPPADSQGPNPVEEAGGKRFIYHWGPVTFWEAQSRCVNSGGSLACPSNSVQNDYISSIIMSDSWLGVLDYNVEGQFLCSNAERITYTNWGYGQPDNQGNGRNEADFVLTKYDPTSPSHGKWFDSGAMVFLSESKHGYVCEADCEEGQDGCIPNDPAKAM